MNDFEKLPRLVRVSISEWASNNVAEYGLLYGQRQLCELNESELCLLFARIAYKTPVVISDEWKALIASKRETVKTKHSKWKTNLNQLSQ